ncbi:hypothetical protein HDU91_006250 [Kappamyces sp. JEL0680]|nr:hypothetical protein HDU91_006250 [Kappamyces sp. JEL0680]
MKTLRVAVEGCCHGQLDKIYASILNVQKRSGKAVDLVLICGDFQSIRNSHDLQTMSVPDKYKELGNFYEYYSGAKVAPIPTIFIGGWWERLTLGNHEASNYLWELFHGGYVCHNIYYLGAAGVVNFGGLRIAGMSGIFKDHHYDMGFYEKHPLERSDIKSIYHLRSYSVFKLAQADIFLSHDWPLGIARHGNVDELLKYKSFLKREIQENTLGSPPGLFLLERLQPSYWFSAHLHVKFEAAFHHPASPQPVANPDEIDLSDSDDDQAEQAPAETGPKTTRFLALDKCLPKRQFLEILEIPIGEERPLELQLDREWLAILRATQPLLNLTRASSRLPTDGEVQERIKEELAWVQQQDRSFFFPPDFCPTAPAHGQPNADKDRDEWKNLEVSRDYDYELLKDRLQILRDLRKKGDVSAMIFNLRTSLSRNLGDMGNPFLYENTHVGTKTLIEDYIDEVTKQLTFIADAEIAGMSIQDKLEFFRNVQVAFGRTALLLSGGGTFGLAHIGTIKALWEQKLLPRVMTGSSAGSIVAGIFCCKTDKEVQQLLDPRHINLNFFERPYEQGNPFIMLSRLLKHGVIRDVEVFNECLIDNIGDITFAEAFNRTRRILNITVSSSTSYEMPRLLNYLTAPNVLIRSAVAASSAVPFVFKAAPLMAKDANKNIVPWNPSGHKWIDGSVEGDLPMQRISELFGVNHFLVAQTNPHIIPFLNPSEQSSTRLGSLVKSISGIVGGELQHRLSQLIELGIYNNVLLKVHAMICQKYVGDITIVPNMQWSYYFELLSNPYVKMAKTYTNAGERAAWPRIAILRNHCTIEQCLSQNITRLRERLIVAHSDEPLTQALTPLVTHLPVTSQPTSANPVLENEKMAKASFQLGLSPIHAVTFAPTLETAIKDGPDEHSFASRASVIRNHKSAGDVRSVLKKFVPLGNDMGNGAAINNSNRILIREPGTQQMKEPLFYLQLTFDDSSDEDEAQIVPHGRIVSP